MKSFLLALALLSGCAAISPMVYTNGVPNFGVVEPGLYRVGCPTKDGWDYLRQQLHVRTYLKLSFEDECAAGYAEALGMTIIRVEVPPGHFGDLLQGPTQDQLHQIAAIMADDSLRPMAFGCLHGQDRTGLAAGVERLRTGWSREDAYREMVEHHFHAWLRGLKRAWDEYQP